MEMVINASAEIQLRAVMPFVVEEVTMRNVAPIIAIIGMVKCAITLMARAVNHVLGMV